MSRHPHRPEKAVSIHAFARLCGISKGQLVYYCQRGRVEGARFDRVTWQWWIYPPAKLVTGRQP